MAASVAVALEAPHPPIAWFSLRTMERYVSLLGIVVFIGLCWLMSSHKRHFPWRIVICGLLLQVALAKFVTWDVSAAGWGVFDRINILFVGLTDCVDAGTSFVFGDEFAEHFFAFKILPTIIFFSAFMSIFYYFGIIQKVVGAMALVMQKTLGTSGAETLSAAANVFVGQTEAPLVIRPYISSMTKSELNAVMVGGFATMAGGVLGGLAGMGINAGHLLAASVISAPGALLLAKVMQPELEEPKTRGNVKIDVEDPSANVLEAVASGAVGGLQLALNVGAMLIVFLALIAVVNAVLAVVGDAFWQLIGRFELAEVPADPGPWSLEGILGFLFRPIAWLIGIEWSECALAGELMGLKMATNEFVAYGRLAEWAPRLETGEYDTSVVSERTRTILTYALCGFANFSSIGIQLGGIGGIAPERRSDLARLGLRAMIGGTLAAFVTACIVSLLYISPS